MPKIQFLENGDLECGEDSDEEQMSDTEVEDKNEKVKPNPKNQRKTTITELN